MPTLEIFHEGAKKKLEYSDVCVKGIYFTDENDHALANCSRFKIKFDEPGQVGEVQHVFSRFRDFSILTSRGGTEYAQYIILDEASKNHIHELAGSLPPNVGRLLFLSAIKL